MGDWVTLRHIVQQNCINDLSLLYTDIQHVILMLRDAGMDVDEIQDFTKRYGGKMLNADENRIAGSGDRAAMLYAVKRG
jgi:hypothetical protein